MDGVAPLTIGRSCSLVLLVLGSRIDLRGIEGFDARQEVQTKSFWPINADPVELVLAAGWRGSFLVPRDGPTLDDLFAALEMAQRFGGFVAGNSGSATLAGTSSTIYQYVSEPDGSQSTYQFGGASLTLASAGQYRSTEIVRQSVAFFAATRMRL